MRKNNKVVWGQRLIRLKFKWVSCILSDNTMFRVVSWAVSICSGEGLSQDERPEDSEITLYDSVMSTQGRYTQPVQYCLIFKVFKRILKIKEVTSSY